jgi:hypothetical protein
MKKNVFHRELLTSLRLDTGKAKRAAKILTTILINNKLFKDLLELLSLLLEARVMAQPKKVDFDVRKVLMRKKVSRDRMTLSEH